MNRISTDFLFYVGIGLAVMGVLGTPLFYLIVLAAEKHLTKQAKKEGRL